MEKEKKKTSRKDIIKNIAIIFLILLLILTFFSNTILKASLPEVSAQYPKYTTLSSSVKVTGTIRSRNTLDVVYENVKDADMVQTRKVLSVYVREGDMVSEGQVIMTVSQEFSDELKSAIEQYDSLKNQYDLSVLDDNINSMSDNQRLESARKEIENAKDSLQRMRETYQASLQGKDTGAILQTQLEKLQEDLEKLNEEMEGVSAEISETESAVSQAKMLLKESGTSSEELVTRLQDAQWNYITAEEEYTALKNTCDSLEAQISELSEQISDMTEARSITQVIESLNSEIESLKEQAAELRLQLFSEEGYNEDIADQIDAIYDQISARKSNLEEQYIKLEIIGMETVDELTLYAFNRQLSDLQKDLEKKRAPLGEAQEKYNTAKSEYDNLTKINEDVGNLPQNETKLLELKNRLSQLQADQKNLNKEVADTQRKIDNNVIQDPETLAESIKSQEDNIRSLETQYQITVAQQGRSNESTKREREEQRKQMEELQAKIQSYQNAPSTSDIVAPTSGRVVTLYNTVGSKVSSGNTVATLDITDKGYTCEVTLSADEAKKVQVGSPVSVVNSWWYSNIEAQVTNIRSDPQTQGKQRIITLSVTGDVYDGQSVNFQIGDSSQYYSNVLPNSAIRVDNDGKYVLVVESKSTPLGMKYNARRIAVTVVASDDTQSAVTGLTGSEFVITNATSPISDKQQVRLAEEK
ncbi:MAG: HlyD family efflux transporter periplasmic adaptor subunit [Clostridia bacterium]|nr:HlyD family efflux transporter periplasmic adaptor subunit [Clostridia bacterium]